MRKIAVIAVWAGLVVGTGCLRTMAPILEDKDLIADASLAGKWVTEDGTESLRIGAPDAKKVYQIEYIDEQGKSGRFVARMGRVGELTVAEVTPADLPDEWSDAYKGQYAPLISLWVVKATKPALRFSSFETEWVDQYLSGHPGELTVAPNDKHLVTSGPEAIRAFLLKHWKDKGALTEDAVLVRREGEK